MSIFSCKVLFKLLIESKRDVGEQEENLFKTIYEVAEKEVLKEGKQSFENFNEAIKAQIFEFLPKIRFHKMSDSFLMEYIGDKASLFTPSDLAIIFTESNDGEEERFKNVYKLAEIQALKKQKTSKDKDFDFFEEIKTNLAHVIPLAEFQFAKLQSHQPQNSSVQLQNEKFEQYQNQQIDHQLMEHQGGSHLEQVENSQQSPRNQHSIHYQNDHIHIKSIQSENAHVQLQNHNQITSPQTFPTDHRAVESQELSPVTVEIRNNNFSLTGTFNDTFDILNTFGKYNVAEVAYHGLKHRFPAFKFSHPSTLSEIKKNDEIDWYLCFEANIVLSVKHRTLIAKNDFLIAELKSPGGKRFSNFKKHFPICLKITALREQHLQETEQQLQNQQIDQLSTKQQDSQFLHQVQNQQQQQDTVQSQYQQLLQAQMQLQSKPLLYHQTASVEIKYNYFSLTGTFDDKIGILNSVGKIEIEILPCHRFKHRFTYFKFPRQLIPSELKKKNVIDWCLCLEDDGVLTVKHRKLIDESDYLIATLKSSPKKFWHFEKKYSICLKIAALNPHHYPSPVPYQNHQRLETPQFQQHVNQPSQMQPKNYQQLQQHFIQQILRPFGSCQSTPINQLQNSLPYQLQNQQYHYQQVLEPQVYQQFNPQSFNNTFQTYPQHQNNYYPRYPGC